MRFQVSVHSFSCLGSWLGGTRQPLLDMNRRTFFRFSGTASSYTVHITVSLTICSLSLEGVRSELTKLSP